MSRFLGRRSVQQEAVPVMRRARKPSLSPQAALLSGTAPSAPPSSQSVDIEEIRVPLPVLTKENAKKVLSARGLSKDGLPEEVYGSDRKVDAMLVYKTSATKAGLGKKPAPVVIFGHGFSQPPENYRKTIYGLAEQGCVVIAPRTSTFGAAAPWIKVPGSGRGAQAPTKLQAAIITDMLRSALYLKESWKGAPLGPITLAGHSMGGGSAIVASSYLDNVAGVAVAAPAVAGLLKSPINPLLHMAGGAKRRGDLKAAADFFLNLFPDNARLHLIGANQDQIVKPLEVALLFAAAKKAKDAKKLKDVTLFRVDGSHIGFEDSVNIDADNKIISALFSVVNYLIYTREILKVAMRDPSVQRGQFEVLLEDSVAEFMGGTSKLDALGDGVFEVSSMADLPADEQDSLVITADKSVEIQAEFIPATAAVLSYAGAHGFTVFKAVMMLLGAGLSLDRPAGDWGLLGLSLIAFSLVYDNSLLAGGRFIGQGPVLQSLSSTRFLAHSAAPLLALVGMDLARRAGVEWAGNDFVDIGVKSFVGISIAISAFRNYFWLETRPECELGILRYTYDDAAVDFTRLIPVISTSLLLGALGVSAWKRDPSLLVLAAGPIASTVLQAIPSKVLPQFILGNLGEVILLGSLCYSEEILRSHGM